MVTRVQFLHSTPDRIQAAAAWIAEAWKRREPVTVYAPRSDLANRLDHQLWVAPALSFVPHCRGDSPLASETPIVITDRLETAQPGSALLNLSDETPPDFGRFETLVEVVSTEDAVRLPARDRARAYKEQGLTVEFKDASHGI